MNLIELYVDTVKRYLPEDLKEDVGLELTANIMDMLPENHTEDDVVLVLTKLGSPRKLADEYNTKKKYLIGPSYYNKYISLLKSVIVICVFVALAVTFLEWVLKSPADWLETDGLIRLIVGLIAELLASAFSGAIQGAFWVTVAFAIIEKTGVEIGYTPFRNKKWTPYDLPDVSDEGKNKISRGETVFSMVVTVVFIALFVFRPEMIAVYLKGDHGTYAVTTFFNMARLQAYIPGILAFALIQLGLSVWKFTAEHRSLPMAIIEVVTNLGIIVLVGFMLSDQALLNNEFVTALSNYLGTGADTVSKVIDASMRVTGFTFVVIYVWESALLLIRTLNAEKIQDRSRQ